MDMSVDNICNKKCMSHLNNQHPDQQCTRDAIKNRDFCKYHLRSHIYMKDVKNNNVSNWKVKWCVIKLINKLNKSVEVLDKKYDYCLLGMQNSWKDVPFIYWFKLRKDWWDIRFLVNTFTIQLNQSELEEPFAVYPTNPFTRQPLTVNELMTIRNKIIEIKLQVNNSLKIFLNSPKKLLAECYRIFMKNRYNASQKIISILNKKLRFKMVNCKNSQSDYCGVWVNKTQKRTPFEQIYHMFKLTPLQIVNINHSTNDIRILNNPEKIRLARLLSKFKVDNINITNEALELLI